MNSIGASHSASRGAAEGRPWRSWRVVAALGAIATAGLLATGCGGAEESDSDGISEASAESDTAVAYSECMRENGVPEFPDPVNGRLQIQATPGGGLDPSSPEFQQAQEACQDMAPSGAEAGAAPPEELQNQALEHAQCMRENGVPEFPDPNFDGGTVQMQLPPGIDPEALEKAQQACQDLAPGGLGGAP